MAVHLNHTIVPAKDRDETAAFLVDVLGLDPAPVYGPFRVVSLDNDVSLDVVQTDAPVPSQHYAFLVSDEEFDQIRRRIQERGLTYWADPFHQEPGRINTNDGGRGLYWSDPNGHNLEIITVPYGGG
ncbi:glyoxalase/bleomycin resistance protein/dioxygenase superfamily protein [Nonomuraea polychroma]|uniref:Glyoxalase/bleomycin resistance protein/dioxygenase superfamily protein n=1 Tax=Nonomuraea polychroma TaxID=46176 RepID=A0A438M3Q4_9ACTN|nr:VOC family protein [Nonomuraea polychroma]RVX40083.1 glyoxalase/bleomycin resistance protein/dioxygenase superfamily protein [Nonomuraea polychroma]